MNSISNSTSNLTSRNGDRKATWSLGGIEVNRIGYGTKRLAGDGSNSRRDAVDLLRRATELGVNHLDTAAFYPTYATDGRTRDFTSLRWANEVIREALTPYDDDLVIATKIGPTPRGQARPDELRELVERDLRDLGLDTLHLVYLRQAGLDSIAEYFGVLAELREQGLIRHLGLSNVRAEQLAEVQTIAPVVAVQNRYGVDFGRINDDLLVSCGEQGIAFVPFFSVAGADREAGGVAGTSPEAGVATADPVREIAAKYDVTPAQIRIAWTLHRGPHVLAIPGTADLDHLAANVEAADLRLTDDDLAALDLTPRD